MADKVFLVSRRVEVPCNSNMAPKPYATNQFELPRFWTQCMSLESSGHHDAGDADLG